MKINQAKYRACLACLIDKQSDKEKSILSLLDRFSIAFTDFLGRVRQNYSGEYTKYKKQYLKMGHGELEIELMTIENGGNVFST